MSSPAQGIVMKQRHYQRKPKRSQKVVAGGQGIAMLQVILCKCTLRSVQENRATYSDANRVDSQIH